MLKDFRSPRNGASSCWRWKETTSRWEVAEVISNKQSRKTDKVLTVNPGGLASGSEFNMSRIVAQGFGLDRPCGNMYVMTNGHDIPGLDSQMPLVGQGH